MAKMKQVELEKLAQDTLDSDKDFLENSPTPKRKRPTKTKVAKVGKIPPNNSYHIILVKEFQRQKIPALVSCQSCLL